MASFGRLRRRTEFQRVYAEGVKVAGRYVVVFAQAREDRSSRLGITATRRCGGSVVRNRARRRVRALVQRHGFGCEGAGIDVVVNVRRGCAEAPWSEVEKDYLECLTRVARRLQRLAS